MSYTYHRNMILLDYNHICKKVGGINMLNEVKVGLIGLGNRGYFLYHDVISVFPFVRIRALCDLYDDRIEKAYNEAIEHEPSAQILKTNDYRELLKADLDCVIVMTSWETHTEIVCAAMEKGIPVACEVSGAVDIQECFRLVETYERTKTPVMFLENCCYGKIEGTVQNMVRAGLFGDIVYCSGSYGHDLRLEIANGTADRHYRERHYLTRNCENYPTHELGPIAKLLNINRGNRMVSLTCTASCSKGLADYVKRGKKHDAAAEQPFRQADVVIALITCENGELIQVKLDTTLPRSYCREFAVAGTRGRYTELYDEVFLDGDYEWKKSKPLSEYNEYLPEMWKREEEIKALGHGGMDYLVFEDFFECLRAGKPMPIDVYDMASWMAVTPLSELALKTGKTVEFPDFTHGQYKNR